MVYGGYKYYNHNEVHEFTQRVATASDNNFSCDQYDPVIKNDDGTGKVLGRDASFCIFEFFASMRCIEFDLDF